MTNKRPKLKVIVAAIFEKKIYITINYLDKDMYRLLIVYKNKNLMNSKLTKG